MKADPLDIAMLHSCNIDSYINVVQVAAQAQLGLCHVSREKGPPVRSHKPFLDLQIS